MKITGYRIQHKLRELTTELAVVVSQFEDSITKFPDEQKDHPRTLFDRCNDLEYRIATLQTVQAKYNLAVQVDILGKKWSLAHAVKLVGGAGRNEKMWRSFAKIKKEKYSYSEATRNKDNVYEIRVMSPDECLIEAKKAARFVAAIREAIQIGNATEIELDADLSLFE